MLEKMNKKLIQFVLGIMIALIGAIIMFDGSLFGERTTVIAIIIGIVGIVLISTSSPWKVTKS